MRFLFVLSSVAKNEKILTAELHLFRLWPRVTDGPKRHHFCQVRMGMGMGMDCPLACAHGCPWCTVVICLQWEHGVALGSHEQMFHRESR